MIFCALLPTPGFVLRGENSPADAPCFYRDCYNELNRRYLEDVSVSILRSSRRMAVRRSSKNP